MKNLYTKTLVSLVALAVVMGLLIFVSAGTKFPRTYQDLMHRTICCASLFVSHWWPSPFERSSIYTAPLWRTSGLKTTERSPQ